jgi:hypothetical protein
MFKLLTAFAMSTLFAPVYAGLFDYSPAKGVMYPGTLLSFSLIITRELMSLQKRVGRAKVPIYSMLIEVPVQVT